MLDYLKTHVFYVILIAVGLLAFHSWLSEHDSRLMAEQATKLAQQQVDQYKQQIAQTSAIADKKVKDVQTQVTQAKTPAQVVQAVPSLSDVPLNARLAPEYPGAVVVDAQALIQEVGQCRQTGIQLGACQANSEAKDKIILARETEITAIKKPKTFWKNVGTGLKIAITSISIFEVVRAAGGRP